MTDPLTQEVKRRQFIEILKGNLDLLFGRKKMYKNCENSGVVGIKSPLDTQVGGDHYKNFPIQPIEFCQVNGLGFIEGCIVKRLCRYNRQGGKGLEDLEKARHEIDILIELETAKQVMLQAEELRREGLNRSLSHGDAEGQARQRR